MSMVAKPPPDLRDSAQSWSTVADLVSEGDQRWRHRVRNAVFIGFLLFLLVGAAGTFELTRQQSLTAAGITAMLESPRTTRAGADIQLLLDLEAEEGSLPTSVSVLFDRSYLALFEDLSFTPEPAKMQTTSSELVRLFFEVEPGSSELRISAEGRAADAWMPRTTGMLRVEGQDATPGPQFELRTWRLP